MVFVPKFDAKYICKIHLNLEAIIRAGEADALFWANEGHSMLPFAVYRRSQWYNTLHPVISIIPLRSDIDQAADDSRLDETHRFEIMIEDAGANPDELVDSVEKRMLAIDQILRQATIDEVLNGHNPATSGGYSMEISPHEYFQVPRGQTNYLQLGSFTVIVAVIESRMP